MTVPAPTAVIVVDAVGHNGRCSHCNQKADIDTAHSCGAKVIGVAINAVLMQNPSLGRAQAIADLCPPGVPFIGTGDIVSVQYGFSFRPWRRVEDLS